MLKSPPVSGQHIELTKPDYVLAPPRGTIKTIKGDDGYVVDCVDMYKQPAFDHPLLKDHKIQMEPSSSPQNMNQNNASPDKFVQPWHKSGLCSKGTVPIRRRRLQGQSHKMKKQSNDTTKGPHSEFATVQAFPATGTRFYGGSASISIWDPAVSRQDDYSESTMLVQLSSTSFLMAGWIVFPKQYHDFRPRLFIYFTTDNSTATRCWDLDCNGFVQVNNIYTLGSLINTVSTLGDRTYYAMKTAIYQDRKTRNWWVSFEDNPIGYWPASLFPGLPEGAEMLQWGGTVYDSVGERAHTQTDMGNGFFPDVRTNKASLVCSLQYVDDSNTLQIPGLSMLGVLATKPLCYNVQLIPELDPNLGQCFLFGGPGRNPLCP
ncbi:hypothetical protein BVRB_9g211760 [Beta vulgaris subsp. vulgaris]|nr:hypothetical protein BVRB_9g211760 [Beta vulgaris subsp. vulgaris]